MEAVVSDSRAEMIAGRAHRLYVFGVVFSALFLLGFVLTAMIAADIREPVAVPPQVGKSSLFGKALPTEKVDPTVGARLALDQVLVARHAVDRSREQLGAAERTLFRFLYDQLVETSSAAAAPVGPATAILETTGDQNPQLTELERELADARQRKTSLLERLTPSHPTVQSLDSSIADLQERLESARRTKVIEPAPGFLQLPTVEVRSDVAGSNRTAALNKARDLIVAAGHAQREYDAAMEKESVCWTEYSHLPSVAAAAGARILAKTSVQESSTPKPVIALGGFFVLAFGCGIAAARRAKYHLPTFGAIDEVEARLGIPVLGRLAWAGPEGTSLSSELLTEPRWLRRSITLSEIVLALAIGSLVLLAITNFPLLRQIADDPLSGIAQGIGKIRDLAGN
jgi:hypothetical protein